MKFSSPAISGLTDAMVAAIIKTGALTRAAISTTWATVATQVGVSTSPGWIPLTYMPYIPNTVTIGVDPSVLWRYMPFTARGLSPIKALGIQVIAAATGGTCLLQFAVYNSDGAGGGPGTLVADLSASGTIDCTTAGVKTLNLLASLALADGNYWIAAMWSGTATTGPQFEGCAGGHPAVSLNAAAPALNITAYYQNSAAVPNPAVVAGGTSGIVIWMEQ